MTNAELHLCKPKSKLLIFAPIIMYFQKLPFSHSVIEHDGHIYESTFPFAKKSKADEWKNKYIIVETYNVLVDKDLMESMLGAYYSITQLFWALFDIKKALNGVKGLVCTEFCMRAMGQVKDADNYDLKDLRLLAASLQVGLDS